MNEIKGEQHSHSLSLNVSEALLVSDNKLPKTKRVASLDIFRGLTVALMILVDDAGGQWPLIAHAPWNGCNLADFVMPFFLFIVGMAIPLSLKRIPNRLLAVKKVLVRTLKLLFWGLLLQGGFSHAPDHLTYGVDMKHIRWCGILQRIALAYLVVALVEIFSKGGQARDPEPTHLSIFKLYYWHWLMGACILTVYMALLYGIYVPDWQFTVHNPDSIYNGTTFTVTCGVRGKLDPTCNAVGYIDRELLGINHVYKRPAWRRSEACTVKPPYEGPFKKSAPSWCYAPFDPEGILSSVSAILSTIIGLHFGHAKVCFRGIMATEGKADAAAAAAAAASFGKKRKRYLPHNKPVKKGSYPLRPGVQGFFITCDGGREHQASREALNILDSFYEELVHGEHSSGKELPNKPLNTKITFADSDSSSSDDEDEDADKKEVQVQEGVEEKEDKKPKLDICNSDSAGHGNGTGEKSDPHKIDDLPAQAGDKANDNKGGIKNPKTIKDTTDELPAVKQCCKTNVPTRDLSEKVEEKSIDTLIEDELTELRDKNKRRFVKLDSGCNGVVFVQMRKKDGDHSPKDIVHRIVTSAASTRKHMSRFILRILPIEVTCYASKEEISNAIKPLVEQYFPVETQNPHKFAVLYEARANTGIDRMEIIDAVAKSVPGPHKVDLNNPDKTIVVEIAKTVCMIGVIEKYKELSKYNIRQLTSSKA